jgi:hypothetical protein
MDDESFFPEMWHRDLRSWFQHFISDFVKTFAILAGLYLFWEVIAWLRYRGYPDNLCQQLEKAHFAFMFSALCITGSNFVIKQLFGLWKRPS